MALTSLTSLNSLTSPFAKVELVTVFLGYGCKDTAIFPMPQYLKIMVWHEYLHIMTRLRLLLSTTKKTASKSKEAVEKKTTSKKASEKKEESKAE